MDARLVQALADRQAITEMIHHYCRAVDRLDVPLGRSIWHEGAMPITERPCTRATGAG